MAFPRIGGVGIPLNVASGLAPPGGTSQGLTNGITLLPGKRYIIPAGIYALDLDLVSNVEFLDPVTGIWRVMSAAYADGHTVVNSDGANFAIANMTGFPVGGLITNAGTGYTNGIGTAATGLTITPSAGASTWVPSRAARSTRSRSSTKARATSRRRGSPSSTMCATRPPPAGLARSTRRPC
jgi:hypothetical protein